MFYYLYDVRNNVNGKIYRGVHKTKNMDDGYMGSGKVIISAIKKYGLENFTKIILETFTNEKDMFEREKEAVDEAFLSRDDVYNLRRGGHGGFDWINANGLSDYKEHGSKGGRVTVERHGSEHYKKICSKGGKKTYQLHGSIFEDRAFCQEMSERARTPEVIEKRKQTFEKIRHQQGEKNSQFGTMWVTNGKENKKIKKTDFVPEGWNRGRKYEMD